MKPLTICNTAVRQDTDGRYCLNDLHRAAMARGKATKNHRPGNFMRQDQTKRLITAAIARCSDLSIAPVAVVRGGDSAGQGTFAAKPLVYAYAMWIDADFNLDVIEAFDVMQTASLGLWKQMQALIAQEVESKVRASFGSRLMLERKREIPYFREERQQIESQIQPSLLN
jgi:hypothetical protein